MITRRKDQGTEDARTLARVQGALEGYLASGAGSVSVAHVLDLLNPRGLWTHDPERRRAVQEAPRAAPAYDIDPVTGCRSAAAPPSS
jgi:hypothetical protein